MDFIQLVFANLAVICAIMTLMWLGSIPLKDASIVDPFWGLGFVIIGWTSIALVDESSLGPRSWLIVGLVTVWGLRLSGYLSWRNLGHGEDKRYAAMREKRGASFIWKSLFIVFLLQGVIMNGVSLPVTRSVVSVSPLNWLDGIGFGIWGVGLFFETVGDFQLSRFKADATNRGEVMDRGLWRYTRHPNYFGDFCVWWGLYLIALAGGGWWTVISPLAMSFFLMRVSGVTLLEKSLKQNRPGYEEYIRRTSAFFPWPPKPAEQ